MDLRLSPGRSSLGSEWVRSVTPRSDTNWASSSGTTQQLRRLTYTVSISTRKPLLWPPLEHLKLIL